jgi:SAM-dependent methyltransferase
MRFLIGDYAFLTTHRQRWEQKPMLRHLYRDQYYTPLLKNRAAGPMTLEIGSGPGFLAEIEPDIWRTDILPNPWIHCAVDALSMPFASSMADNVIGLDVLHHFNYPVRALQEMARVLRPGGRLVLIEPWVTPLSWFIYNYFHQEDCDVSKQPWNGESQYEEKKNAFDANQAIPYLLVTKGLSSVAEQIPDLRLIKKESFSSLTFLLSGGFKSFSLLPAPLYDILYGIERFTLPLWRQCAAFRVLLVWEKVPV